MIAFASRTGTRRNLAALRAAGWGLLVSATGPHRTEGFELYCLDNGAWTAHQAGTEWDGAAFVKLVRSLGAGASFVVAPDIVSGGIASLDLSAAWIPWLRLHTPRVLIHVQNGMRPDDVRGYLGPCVGIFLGGDTDYKLATMAQWGAVARETGCYYHVGRVNSASRIQKCAMAGAASFDGTSASRFAVTLRPLDAARRQTAWIV